MTARIAIPPLSALATACFIASGTARAGDNEGILAPEAHEVGVEEQLGEYADPSLKFVDHEGRSATLGDFFDGKRPVLLTLNYYRCPTLCNVQLNALTETLRNTEWTAGENYRIVTVSIDPRETTEIGSVKRARHLEALGKGDVNWTFLTSDALQIQLLAAQVGIGYAYDRDQDQYAHPPVIVFLSPEGKIARYLYGLEYSPADLKFAVVEAGEGRVGSTVDKLILSCFHYDADIGKYGPTAMGIMRLAGVGMIFLVGIPLIAVWRRERRRTLTSEAHT